MEDIKELKIKKKDKIFYLYTCYYNGKYDKYKISFKNKTKLFYVILDIVLD